MNDEDRNLFRGYGIEVTLPDADSFLKVKETLTRMGVASRKENTLYQSCHILHKQGRYAITHFKELFALDGKNTDITEDDLARRNTIIKLLEEWELLKVRFLIDIMGKPLASLSQIKILPYKEKNSWNLRAKYSLGVARK
jgi:hypothetical protein